MDTPTQPVARALDDFTRAGGMTAAFKAGETGLGHHWRLLSPTGDLLARTVRVHSGGKAAQAFWKFLSLTALDAGNDIHVELRGADDCVLARASSINDKPAFVTVTDPSGAQVVKSKRDKDILTIYGADDQPIAEVACDGDGPWQVRADGQVLGELIAGEPGPSTSHSVAAWAWDPETAVSSAAYAKGQHLGLRRVKQYMFAPQGETTTGVVLLPLLAGLTY
ncbi:hypothetical protein [Mycobacterium hubeiense]|uniref:hypothetical protein n=1 Tax=Mycobacterium hubeiense TaxID=1867256 RepID=UPI000C7E9021|nr:hypothetical protein [Mycobacterium sp. QGD 101]